MPDKAPLITHVVRQFLPNKGGLEDVITNLCHALPARGYRSRVVTLDRLYGAPDVVLPARETIAGIDIVRIPWRGSTRYPLAPQVFRHLADADIVHVHAIDFFFDALAWGRLLHRKPLVATTHGGFFHTKKFAALKDVWFNTVSRVSASAYEAIACCSQSDKRMFDRIAASRTVLVENGADIAKFADAAAKTPTRGMITIGRFSTNKQIPRLIDVTAELKSRDPAWQLTIVGVPSDLSEADIRTLIAAKGLEANVRLAVGVSNDDIRRMIGEASLFVSASDYEGFGLVAIEAMSAGLVPVLEPNEAYADLAHKHATIRLTGFANTAPAADAVEAAFGALAGDFDNERSAAIAAAHEYGWQTVAARYTDIYDRILQGTGRP